MPASCARQRSIYSISEYGNITPLMSRVTSWDLYSPWIRNTPMGKARISTRRFVSPLASFIFLLRAPPSPSPFVRARICVYLVIFALSTANKFTFANGKCHFMVRCRNNLSKFSPKDINKKAGSSAASGRLTRPPMPTGFRRGSRIRYETDFR